MKKDLVEVNAKYLEFFALILFPESRHKGALTD